MAKKILVVEDDAVVASYLSDLFTDNGYTALVARDAETGLELLRSERPDLMTLDIDLPRVPRLRLQRRQHEQRHHHGARPV